MLSTDSPKIWIPIGRSSSPNFILMVLFSASRIRASEETNSVMRRSAPNSLQRDLKGISVISSMGAMISGHSPSTMLPILTKKQYFCSKSNEFNSPHEKGLAVVSHSIYKDRLRAHADNPGADHSCDGELVSDHDPVPYGYDKSYSPSFECK